MTMRDPRSDMPDLSIDDMAVVYNILNQHDAAIIAAINVPDMKDRERLAVFLENWLEAVAWQRQEVVDAIRRKAPVGECQRRERARVLFDALCCDGHEAERLSAAVNDAIPPMRDPASDG